MAVPCGFQPMEYEAMTDLLLQYRACGAECREDWLQLLACDNGVPLSEVPRAAGRFGDREDFARLIDFCEGFGFASGPDEHV